MGLCGSRVHFASSVLAKATWLLVLVNSLLRKFSNEDANLEIIAPPSRESGMGVAPGVLPAPPGEPGGVSYRPVHSMDLASTSACALPVRTAPEVA